MAIFTKTAGIPFPNGADHSGNDVNVVDSPAENDGGNPSGFSAAGNGGLPLGTSATGAGKEVVFIATGLVGVANLTANALEP